MTKKGRQLFWGKSENPGYAYEKTAPALRWYGAPEWLIWPCIHLSTNPAKCKLTWLMCTMLLLLNHNAPSPQGCQVSESQFWVIPSLTPPSPHFPTPFSFSHAL